MKKIVPYLVLFLCALLLWDMLFSFGDASFHIDGEEFDGPLGALFGLLLAGGGTLIGLLVTVVVGAVLAVVLTGVGVVIVGALAIAGLAVTATIVPFLLPLLLPLALVWYLVSRARRNRTVHKVAV
ncbi:MULTISPECIES: hypothetical protein [unclassified Massilia]|uniref:hypothetical protein n=1 Tax=unclassified Massilia TaxID=2609279 RepID=UPI001785A957|nr:MULTISPECIES: hypothetical protein [unclassified Massilia]MBD8529643.1 hypothetical protein [Massilia sp. CFBP 13647]MBD8673270.1 hypothetical protein [Massilia sp. CFBP 13721]